MTGNVPDSSIVQRRPYATSVFRILARPHHFPPSFSGRCEQWLGRRRKAEIASEIDEDEPIAVLSSEKTQRECFGAQDGSVNPVGALGAEHRIVAPKFQQVLMQRHDVRIAEGKGSKQ